MENHVAPPVEYPHIVLTYKSSKTGKRLIGGVTIWCKGVRDIESKSGSNFKTVYNSIEAGVYILNDEARAIVTRIGI